MATSLFRDSLLSLSRRKVGFRVGHGEGKARRSRQHLRLQGGKKVGQGLVLLSLDAREVHALDGGIGVSLANKKQQVRPSATRVAVAGIMMLSLLLW
jgi:hypothetical protein